MRIGDWISGACFNWVHRRHLVYNACWEDPRLDRAALELGPQDTVLVITSAGCNVLDYALQEPRHVYAVDMNPRQNALLELKLAGIKRLAFDDFFAMFGRGRLENCREVYLSVLRPELSPAARAFWDGSIDWFTGRGWRQSFYFHGTAGTLARCVNSYIDQIARIRDAILAILSARSLAEQQDIYDERIRGPFWRRFVRWTVGRDATLSMLGVPRAQRRQVERYYAGGISRFIEDCVEAVFARLPLGDNYFWRVYLTGEYTPDCCPEYLRPENFARLKAGLADRISVNTCSLLDFLTDHKVPISRFVLLDHMDWLSSWSRSVLAQEWQAIFDCAAPGARAIWRSGGLQVEYVDPLEVTVAGRCRRVGDLLTYHGDLAAELHVRDRVHTYGSFYIADLAAA
jgi:S-adenosylmethionine-diacylglycerol 3-amino-3-carboxypropyl transferase